ncbi:hypothetical protein Csa_011169 [Cucumis sativus]|nr:hypothetical protein Csa_011169 [Cucumis sativus]
MNIKLNNKMMRELSVWDCGSPLYDSYELASLAHLIDRNLLAFPPPYHAGSRRITSNKVSHFHFSHLTPPPPSAVINASLEKKPPAVVDELKNKLKKFKSTFRFSSISNRFGLWRKKQFQV